MKTSMSTIVFFVVVLSISDMSLAKENPVETCIRRTISQSLSLSPSPSPSDKPTTSNILVVDDMCREGTRILMYFLKLNRKFPSYYVKAMCNVFGNDEKKVKEYVTNKWLIHSKKLLNSLTCIRRTTLVVKKNPLEACIRRNIAEWLSTSPSKKPKTYQFGDDFCRDEARVIMYYLKLHGKFPRYYVKALCHVFGHDEKKVKEYVIKRWLNHSEKLINSLACASL